MLVTVILVKNSTSISYSYTIIFHVATRSILFLSLSLSLSLSLCLAGYKIIVSQFICSHTAFTYTKRNISDFSQTRKKQKKKLERRINRGGGIENNKKTSREKIHDPVTRLMKKATKAQILRKNKFKYLIS